jgi:hypothetical protein
LWVHACIRGVAIKGWILLWVQYSHKDKQFNSEQRCTLCYKNVRRAPSILSPTFVLSTMVLSVLNTVPSCCDTENFPSQDLLASPQKPRTSHRRSRAHNIPGGIKHLLSDPKRRRRVSARPTPQPLSPRKNFRSTRPRHKDARTIAKIASSTPASGVQCPQSHSSVPINVTFPRRLPDLPRKQISSEVLASLGFSSEVPTQYIRDRIERLAPRYEFSALYVSLANALATVCIRCCG